MPTKTKKTLAQSAAALALLLGAGAVGHVLTAQAESTTSVVDFEVRADETRVWYMTAHAQTCIAQEGREKACAATHFEVPMTPELLDALGSVRDAAQAAFEAKQAKP